MYNHQCFRMCKLLHIAKQAIIQVYLCIIITSLDLQLMIQHKCLSYLACKNQGSYFMVRTPSKSTNQVSLATNCLLECIHLNSNRQHYFPSLELYLRSQAVKCINSKALNNIRDQINMLKATNIKGQAFILHSAKNKVFNPQEFDSITALKSQVFDIHLATFHIKALILAANRIFTLEYLLTGKGCIKGSCLDSCKDFDQVALLGCQLYSQDSSSFPFHQVS